MHGRAFQLPRRLMLAWAGGSALGALTHAQADSPPTGWVQPRQPAPAFRITRTDGHRVPLARATTGKVTAVQLMFTGCSATCPVQGALFAALAGRLRRNDVQLLSISIDALGDTPATLSAWQGRFGLHPAWSAAVAEVSEVDQLTGFMKGAPARPGTHTAQVFVFDRTARLCFRTGDSPALSEVEALLARVASPA
jgi:protein SCO1